MEGWGHWVVMGWDEFELRYYIGIVKGVVVEDGKVSVGDSPTRDDLYSSLGRICFLFGETRDAERLHLHICLHHRQPLPIHPQQGE